MLEWLTHSGEQLLMFTVVLHNEGHNEQPAEDVHRAGSRRIPRPGASVPVELGPVPPPAPRGVHIPDFGVFEEALLVGMTDR